MAERLSVSLDDKSKEKLEKMRKMTGKSTSELIRDLIDLGYDIYQLGVDTDSLEAWVDYLAKRQHMILDIEHWRVIFNEIEGVNNSEFWRQMEEIGLSHAVQYKMKGLDTVEKILRYVEKANWYEIKDEGQNLKAEIKEGFGKLIVVEK
ncbi:ribbon-helix-helix protein, CopG family [Archaeoglobus sp.]|uniref:ribbon-helix-helix protein, CopG family n=1 Tax=Archaeoglobus sp. TaxID=1872626 RepID=UPI0024AB9E5A|nr:ribbon-helix-helix protein, CopG family [Archaeoglobus sp.]MDI3497175.1 hypothetical protein [Archaeoglobus sp.]